MAEFNGKQGRWVTVEGRHLFIEDGTTGDNSTAKGKAGMPKLSADIGNKIAKSYSDAKDDFEAIVKYFTDNSDKKEDFLDFLKDYPYVSSELVLDTALAFKRNKPQLIYDSKGRTNFLRAYLKYTNPDMSDKDIEAQVLSDTQKKHSIMFGKDSVDKQEKEIAERAKQAKELNDEKKANDYESRKQEIVNKYRKELKSYLNANNGKLPRRLNMGTTTVQRDAVLSALDSEYTLSSAEEKIWDKIQFQNRDGVPYIWLPGKAPISTLGLSNKAISGLRKWLSVWGAENLD